MSPLARRTALALLFLLAARHTQAAEPHPLDPLSQAEIAAAAALVKKDARFPKGAFFASISRREPPKKEVLAYRPGTPFRREALVVALDREKNATYEIVVDLRARKARSWKPRPGAQPAVLLEEYDTVPKIVKADPRWQQAMRARGIENLDDVWIDVWANGHFAPPGHESARLLRALSYLQGSGINYYSRPIEGVTAVVDMNQRKIVEFIDTGAVPVAAGLEELDEQTLGRREDLKPLRIEQPEGPSFRIDGFQVSWQKWQFRFAMQPREALVLYDVSYQDGERRRPILYRGGLAEMVVPYFDPDASWVWRNAFDEGEYGLGRLASPLEPERDAPPNAVFFPAEFSDDFGAPYALANAVGLYERDSGILWKHYDMNHEDNQTRRARELVLFFVATIGNYDYAVQWIFQQDGSLALDVALTGIMLAKGASDPAPDEHEHEGPSTGHRVARNIVAPHHQHFFNVRLDLDVDGPENSVIETNVRPASGGDPDDNRITMEDTLLADEGEAQRDLDLASSRRWRIVHPGKRNALGGVPGFALLPGENSVPYLKPDSVVRQRARFIDHHFWVTRYKDDELYAAGPYPNQSRGGEGLPRYAADREGLEGGDLVVWYTMGVTHLPRPEEWPVMSAHHIGFRLVPAGFFERNPALDVPR